MYSWNPRCETSPYFLDDFQMTEEIYVRENLVEPEAWTKGCLLCKGAGSAQISKDTGTETVAKRQAPAQPRAGQLHLPALLLLPVSSLAPGQEADSTRDPPVPQQPLTSAPTPPPLIHTAPFLSSQLLRGRSGEIWSYLPIST